MVLRQRRRERSHDSYDSTNGAGEHGEADVGAVAECGDATERLSVSVGGAQSALGTEHADMSVHEGEQRVVDSLLRVAVAWMMSAVL